MYISLARLRDCETIFRPVPPGGLGLSNRLNYPHLRHQEIFDSVETFYRRFYLRAPKIAAIVSEMVRRPQMMQRRLREGIEFFHFLRERRGVAH